jgi:photosystem II Psb27 protein
MVAFLRRALFRPLVALCLCLCLSLGLSACGTSGNGLSGNYVEDTVLTAQTLLTTIAQPQDAPDRGESEARAKALMNDWTSRYRPRGDLRNLPSFTTMQTALNSLAGHYANYANRPLPDALRSRLEKELRKAETSVSRGA